jgi:acylglycerol lipase
MAVYTYDQRGSGETPMRGRWPGAATARTRRRRCARPTPSCRFALLGERMGGSVALAGLASGRVDGVDRLILAAPGVRGGVQLRQLHDLALRMGALALP